MTPIDEFINHSQQIGRQLDLVQGAGGNTSIKLSFNQMAIKSSGTRLADMNHEQGYVVVNTKPLEQILDQASEEPNPVAAENFFHRNLARLVAADSPERPSMETAMHLYFPTHVVHTHSIYANVFTCMKDGESVLSSLFRSDKPQYVEYVTPGHALAQRIRRLPKREHRSSVIFLMNHGVITAGDQVLDAYQKMRKVNSRCREYLRNQLNSWPDFVVGKLQPTQIGNDQFYLSKNQLIASYLDTLKSADQVVERSCFPDSVVFCAKKLLVTDQNYCQSDLAKFTSKHGYRPTITIVSGQGILYHGQPSVIESVQAIFEAVLYVQMTIGALRAHVQPLKPVHQNILLSLDSEKYRQNVNL